MDSDALKPVLEALLFAADTPVRVERLEEVIEGVSADDIRTALASLQEESEAPHRGVLLLEVADGFQYRTKAEYAAYVARLVAAKPTRLSRAALETLAIVAYKQPITRAEVEDIRGVDVGGILRLLLDRRLVRIVGKKEVPGRPFLYGTTREFLDVFGLKDLASLPTLADWTEMAGAGSAPDLLTPATPAEAPARGSPEEA